MNILCTGSAQGLVRALQGVFLEFTGARVDGRFGPLGEIREALLAGAPCDVMIVTAPMVAELQEQGRLVPGTEAPLGRVRTGLAMRSEDTRPDISSPEALKATLLAASAIYFPDARRSINGVHFASVLRELGIADAVDRRLHATFPNCAAAMRELAAAKRPGAVGCAQTTEIRYTPGISLIGFLPPDFELATTYAAAVGANAAHPDLARRFIDLLAGARTRVMRQQVGFEAVAAAPACLGASVVG